MRWPPRSPDPRSSAESVVLRVYGHPEGRALELFGVKNPTTNRYEPFHPYSMTGKDQRGLELTGPDLLRLEATHCRRPRRILCADRLGLVLIHISLLVAWQVRAGPPGVCGDEGCRPRAKYMITSGRGVLVSVSSTGGLDVYETLRAAQLTLAETFDAELGDTGVTAFTSAQGPWRRQRLRRPSSWWHPDSDCPPMSSTP